MISQALGQKFYYSESPDVASSNELGSDNHGKRAVANQNEESPDLFKPRSRIIRSIRVENVTVDVFER